MRARITKVSQTNIDIFLVGFFCRRVNFWFSIGLNSIYGCFDMRPQLAKRPKDKVKKRTTPPPTCMCQEAEAGAASLTI